MRTLSPVSVRFLGRVLRRGALAFVPCAALSTACALSPTAPLSIVTPVTALDVDAERKALEAAVCADLASRSCSVLHALDATDGASSLPWQMPDAMPTALTLPVSIGKAGADDGVGGFGDVVHVAPWLESARAMHDVVPSLTVPLAMPKLDAASTSTSTGVAGVSLSAGDVVIADAWLAFDDDTLTFDTPPLRISLIHVDVDGLEDERTVVGVVDAHSGGSGAPSSLSLARGGSDALLRAASSKTSVGSSLVIDALPGAPVGLHVDSARALVKPAGTANVSLHIELDVATSLR